MGLFSTTTTQANRFGEPEESTIYHPVRIAGAVVLGTVALVGAFGAFFLVPEGHIGITTRFAKATGQVGPGLHFKTPFIDGVKKIEVRERKSGEELSAATANQLPINALVTINWLVNSESALDLYRRYGTLDQFEQRILDPKLRQAAKAALSKFDASALIKNRNAAIQEIQTNLVHLMEPYPVTVNSPQIENIDLPPTYMQAVLDKEKAREAAVREEHNLRKQKLEAQRLTQTAEAERDAAKALADGNAYRVLEEAKAEAEAILLKGQAQAKAVDLLQQAIAENPLLVQYEQAKRWGGKLPDTVLGGTQGLPIIYSLPAPK